LNECVDKLTKKLKAWAQQKTQPLNQQMYSWTKRKEKEEEEGETVLNVITCITTTKNKSMHHASLCYITCKVVPPAFATLINTTFRPFAGARRADCIRCRGE
jgi:hypothetical protein